MEIKGKKGVLSAADHNSHQLILFQIGEKYICSKITFTLFKNLVTFSF